MKYLKELYLLGAFIAIAGLSFVIYKQDKEILELKQNLMVVVFMTNQLLGVAHTHQ